MIEKGARSNALKRHKGYDTLTAQGSADLVAGLSDDALPQRMQQAAQDARGAFSDRTIAAYGAGMCKLIQQCDGTVQTHLPPVDPRQLAALVDHVSEALKPASDSNYVSANRAMRRELDLLSPAETGVVRNALERMRRAAAHRG